MPQSKRLIWLDVAKGLAMLLVILGHCLDHDVPLRYFVYSFHMPLFFVLAGFTMRAKPRLTVLVTSARRLLAPYLVVCAILLFFAFVPPSSISPDLDTQLAPDVVLVEILYGSGEPGDFHGLHFEAIGALWFLPCLFVARLVLNEALLAAQKAAGALVRRRPGLAARSEAVELGIAAVLAVVCVWLGFFLGRMAHFPFELDTALVAVGFMFIGLLSRRIGLERVPWFVWLALAVVWMLNPLAGENEMSSRLYLDAPLSLVTATAGSLVVMRLCMNFEHVPLLTKGLAWCGVSSLLILCVHRVEAAVFNWQKIMETVWPQVWDADKLVQGLYWFGLRAVFVVVITWLLSKLIAAISRKRRSGHPDASAPPRISA